MDRGWWGKLLLIVFIAIGSVWVLVPSYYSFFKVERSDRNNEKKIDETMPGWAPPAHYRLALGLDLQGGIHLVLRVDTKTALQKRAERRASEMAKHVADKKLGEVTADSDPEKLQVFLTAKDPATMDAIEKDVLEAYGAEFSKISRDGPRLSLQMKDTIADYFRNDAVDQAMLVIRRRIDKWGVAEVDVRKLGTDAIQISLPGAQDPEAAKALIGTTAQLEFRMVDEASTYFSDLHRSKPPPAGSDIKLVTSGFPQLEGKDREALLAYAIDKEKLPADREVLLECVESKIQRNVCETYKTYLLHKEVPLTGENLSDAYASQGQFGDPEVNITFDTQGGRDFGDLTAKNTGKYMAIVLDNNVNSAPRINEKIPNGRARITMGGAGRNNQERLADAQRLALVLKAGALPAPVTIGEIRQVGASLGDELIRKGSLAAIVGLGLVLVFMAIYYKGSGLIADVALLLNGILILSGLALLRGTLTLPGIAGFVLTLGIAVDANVLINERVREELSHGKTARAAIDQGYDRAFWTIFDAHVTTLIAGFVLFFTGTGPVRGFASALIIGIIASLFTSIVVTRVIVTYVVHGRNAQTVSV